MARGTAGLVGRSALWVIASSALLGTALLTVPRLTDPGGRRGVELVSLTPFGIVPAVVLVIVALALLVLHQAGLRLIAAMFALAGLVSTALHVVWLAPLYTGDQAPGHGDALVVMTQNFEYGDAGALAREVRERQVDVLVLCDMGPGQRAGVEQSSIPTDLPHLAGSDGGVVVFSRHPFAEDEPLELHGSGRSLRMESTPLGPITLFALHPVPPYRAGGWQDDAVRVVDALRTSLPRSPDPTIVAGDLNATLDHWPLRALESLGLTDAVVATNGGFQPTYPASGHEKRFGITVPPLFQIDHVLVSRQLVVTSVDTVETPGADHRGVVASIKAVRR